MPLEVRRVEPTPWQSRVLAIPESIDLALLGGRNVGKTYAALFLILRHITQHVAAARVLYLRKTYKATGTFESEARDLFEAGYPGGVSYNAAEKLFRFANGARLEIGQMESEADYRKFQGQSYSLIVVDEAQQHSDPFLLDRLRSNLRAADVPCRFVLIANAGDRGMWWLSERHRRQRPWLPYTDPASGRRFVWCGGTFRENPHAGEDAEFQIRASVPGDPALLAAWLDNDWDQVQGGFLSDALSWDRSVFEAWTPEQFWAMAWNVTGHRQAGGERFFVSFDHGVAAPAVAFLCLWSVGFEGPDRTWFPKGSLLLVAEVSTAVDGNWARGTGATVPQVARLVTNMTDRWHVPAQGVADPSIFSRHGHEVGSIAAEFRAHRVQFRPGNNDRSAGWSKLRTLAAQAGESDRPGLYVSRACRGFWSTAPTVSRSERNPEDCDSNAVDHWIDAARYAALSQTGRLWRLPVTIGG